MVIEKIRLIHFRNYEKLELEPHEGMNIFFGENGSGKTNLLEAIHYCSLGKSHRISQDIHTVQAGQPGASVQMTVRNRNTRNVIEIRIQPGENAVKSVWIDQHRVTRLSEMMGMLRCVIFSPEDLDLIKEGPSVRRRFLDMMISQISRTYFIALQQYRIAMNQRAAILKNAKISGRKPDAMIEDFEQAMMVHGDCICREREKYEQMLSEESHRLYQEISGRENEHFQIQYRSSFRNRESGKNLKELLEESREEDLKNGNTSVGPHRDDLHLTLNQKSMKAFASQGQMRTGALSLKLAQLQLFQKVTGEAPVLLLDDVMSELDLDRRGNLLRTFQHMQTFLTCADQGDLGAYPDQRTYEVKNRDGLAEVSRIRSGPEKLSPVMKELEFI